MATASVTHTFSTGGTILASQHNTNNSDLVSFLNNETVHKDGSVAMTGLLSLTGTDPSTANQAARKAYVDAGNLLNPRIDSDGTVQAGVSYISGTHQPWVQGASENLTPNGSGEDTITFPRAFPTGLAAVVVTMGELESGLTFIFKVVTHNLSSCVIRTYSDAAAGLFGIHTSGTITVNWIALGW
jgi:hypothetical protein